VSWLLRYRIRYYLRNAIWVWPVVAMAAALAAVRLVHRFEESLGWEAGIDPEAARTLLGTLGGAMFTFIVFVCSSMLLVVQLASAQLTPRVIGTLFRDRVVKLTLAIFVFSFTFALAAMIRIGATVPLLIVQVSAYGCVASIGVFLYLIDHVGKMLRPSGALQSVASQAHRVIDDVFPRPLGSAEASPVGTLQRLDDRPKVIVECPKDGVVLAFDVAGLVDIGSRFDCTIELVPQVGDFIATRYPLCRVYGGNSIPVNIIRQSIALGTERTMEQDPGFAFRLIVDIASKALSPSINDPTTAVLALDRIQHLLRHLGGRRLDDGLVRDAAGHVRLVYRTPSWEDFVKLAVTEIRLFGGASIQIARRLRAVLEDLIQSLPSERVEPLRLELQLLKKSAERFFQDPEDRALAAESDTQGVGGG
jgi:uncharacterized membrane protein